MFKSFPDNKIVLFILLIFLYGSLIPVSAYTSQKADSVVSKADSVASKADSVGLKADSIGLKADSIGLNADSVLLKKRTFTAEEYIRGERLFFGLAYPKEKSIDCASCHYTRVADTLNWNPGALEISQKYLDKGAKDLSEILLNPFGDKMTLSHKGFKLIPEDIILIKAYMDKYAGIGLSKIKPIITNLLLFILASGLFLFSAADLMISKILKKRWINWMILFLTTVFLSYTLAVNAISLGRSYGYSPFQPVKFSHAVHAGQNRIDCIYCHSTAPFSKTAGIPPENVCMNCHLILRTGTRSGAFEIAKITDAFQNNRPVKWIKVHNLPDYVFFSHAQHVSAARVNCRECHGAVEKMDVIKQVSDLSMGWCIDCHRNKKFNFQQNKFYSQYKDLAEKLKKGSVDSVTMSMLGGIECMKCHY